MKKILILLVLLACSLILSADPPPLKVSVLGDSYSTFREWIPQGYAVYYPNEIVDVKNAEECWWYLVISALKGKLERNDSWSGSTICYTGYNKTEVVNSSFLTRVARLGNPDIILICGGTNDCWAKSPIGEYKWEGWTRNDLFSFRPAMAKMLAETKTLYPKAHIYFILNTELTPDIDDSAHAICEHYGIKCIDLVNIKKTSGHPTVTGMKDFAAQVFSAIREDLSKIVPTEAK